MYMANNDDKCKVQANKKWFNRHVIERLKGVVTEILHVIMPYYETQHE